MSVFLSHTGNGFNEGIGATVQYILFTYVLSRDLNLKFNFDGFSNVDQYQFHPEFNVQTWSEKFNSFFNFPNDTINTEHDSLLLNNILEVKDFLKQNTSLTKDTLINLKPKNNGLLSNNPEPYKQYFWELTDRIRHDYLLNKDIFNISIHIRSFNKQDSDTNPIRQYYSDDKKEFYLNLIKQILNEPTEKEKKIYLHTQIGEENFSFLKDLNCNYTVLNNVYPWISLSYMIQSDLLVGANSSFSYIAHLLNKNKSIFRNDFWHTLYNDTSRINSNGNY